MPALSWELIRQLQEKRASQILRIEGKESLNGASKSLFLDIFKDALYPNRCVLAIELHQVSTTTADLVATALGKSKIKALSLNAVDALATAKIMAKLAASNITNLRLYNLGPKATLQIMQNLPDKISQLVLDKLPPFSLEISYIYLSPKTNRPKIILSNVALEWQQRFEDLRLSKPAAQLYEHGVMPRFGYNQQQTMSGLSAQQLPPPTVQAQATSSNSHKLLVLPFPGKLLPPSSSSPNQFFYHKKREAEQATDMLLQLPPLRADLPEDPDDQPIPLPKKVKR